MSSEQPKKRQSSSNAKRKPSKEMQRVYRRRRIVVGAIALVILAALGFGAYALVINVIAPQGGSADSSSSTSDSGKQGRLSKRPKGSANKQSGDAKSDKNQDGKGDEGGVRKCGANDVDLELTPASQKVDVGGSLDFKVTIRYKGSDPCVIDASNSSRILTISAVAGADSDSDSGSGSSSDTKKTSSEQIIWTSGVCPAKPRNLLLAKGDTDEQQITWPTDKTGNTCVPDDQLPKVRRGTYMAQLSLKDHSKLKSEKVPVVVQ
ncbi:hypothetical protein GA0061077_0890 [Bifidobacterium commune]|uniref:Uncharacterized protein n=1 Tax=Bifidobacterium commune TaxID=1505727 RepID=A0A1C4H4M9_9BIFI|nr:hypothetical protein [Bifidobacterium commune]SCC79929.1 hypothetical protein GA0061077_0890 [Bifidobacterium commune]